MPNTLSPLIVPATIAQEDIIRQLLLYCDTVFLYAPAENSHLDLPTELNPLCQQYAPVPFNELLTNFDQLIREMTTHRSEYYGGRLSSLSAQTSAVDEESVWRLIKRLNPGTINTAQQETLFQARLLLKLAEIRDQEEQDIVRTLASLDSQNLALLHGLTAGEDDDAAEIGSLLQHNQQQPEDYLNNRLKAWANLFLADPRMEDHWLLAAPQNILAVLTDYATTRINESPTLILSLPLPQTSLIMALSPAQYLDQRSAWQTATNECLALVRSAITTAAQTGDLIDRAALEQELHSQIKQLNNWGKSEQESLDFWLLPLSLPRLFAKIARKTEPSTTAQTLGHCVVAVPRQALS